MALLPAPHCKGALDGSRKILWPLNPFAVDAARTAHVFEHRIVAMSPRSACRTRRSGWRADRARVAAANPVRQMRFRCIHLDDAADGIAGIRIAPIGDRRLHGPLLHAVSAITSTGPRTLDRSPVGRVEWSTISSTASPPMNRLIPHGGGLMSRAPAGQEVAA